MNRLRRLSLLLLIAALVQATLPVPAVAQERAREDRSNGAEEEPKIEVSREGYVGAAEAPSDFRESHRRALYEQSELSTTGAVWRSLLLPGLGNIYADDWFGGVITMSIFGFGLTSILFAAHTDQPDFYWIGGTLAGGAYIAGTTLSILQVEQYNRLERERLNLASTMGMGWTIRW